VVGEFSQRYGPWALVVGGSAGIGAAVSNEAASRGLNVVMVARRPQVLEDHATAIRSRYGVEVKVLSTDLAEAGAAEAIIAAAGEYEVGTFIYNAAAEPRGAFISLAVAEQVANITVNCTVPTVLSHHFGSLMAARRRGLLVLVTSMGALQGGKVFSSYFAAKAYEWILAEGLWAELGDYGVDAFAYMVGATKTETFKDPAAPTEPVALSDDVGEDARSRLENPSSPDDVGRRLFELIGGGPTEFSHPADAASAERVGTLSRRQAVERMSSLTSRLN
jgi:short-subunit dehydrogenase